MASSTGPGPDSRQSTPAPASASPSPAPNPSTMNLATAPPLNRSFLYYSALGLVVTCPIIMLLPPRKVDLYTLGLGMTWFVSTGYAVEQSTGHSMLWHVGRGLPSARNRERWAETRAARREARQGALGAKAQPPGLLKSALADKDDGWIEERKTKEEKALDEGKGYGGLIMDQVKESVGWKGSSEQDEDKDTREQGKKV